MERRVDVTIESPTDTAVAEEDVDEQLPAVVAALVAHGFVSRVEGNDGLPVVIGSTARREAGRGTEAARAPDGSFGRVPEDGERTAVEKREELSGGGRVHGYASSGSSGS
jgi:hypothetical protein